VKKDATALNRLLADEFNGTSPTAHTFPNVDGPSSWAACDASTIDDVGRVSRSGASPPP